MRKAKMLQAKGRKAVVVAVRPHVFDVTSPTSGNTYRVYANPDTGAFSCSCKYGEHHAGQSGCSHVLAAMQAQAQEVGASTSAWADPAQAKRQHRAVVAEGDGQTVTRRMS